MSSGIPTFSPRQGRPDEPSGQREQIIRAFWIFEKGLSAERLRIPGSKVGALLVIGTDGNVLATTSPSGTIDFTGQISITGTPVNITSQNINLTPGTLLSIIGAGSVEIEATNSDGSAKMVFTTSVDANAKLGFNVNALTATRVLRAQNLAGTLGLVGDDAPAVASGALGKVDLTAQTADIATTALSNTPPAGFYEVEIYLMCTTADAAAGTLTVTIGWTDNVGATTSTPITLFALSTTGRTTGRQLVRLASGNVTYAVAVTGIYGTSQYAIYARVVALG